MTTINQTKYTKDLANKQLVVEREFDAPVALVWRAWTESNLLDQWWAPRPWKAETKKMDFREGGSWMYGMKGPEGEVQWCMMTFDKIVPHKSYTGDDAFCDEKGNFNKDLPIMHWTAEFTPQGDTTVVKIQVKFDSIEDLNKIVEMGFQDGFAAAHGNLDELLASQQ
jgi:uncharacterized protein YndB with AHSA1/START domain